MHLTSNSYLKIISVTVELNLMFKTMGSSDLSGCLAAWYVNHRIKESQIRGMLKRRRRRAKTLVEGREGNFVLYPLSTVILTCMAINARPTTAGNMQGWKGIWRGKSAILTLMAPYFFHLYRSLMSVQRNVYALLSPNAPAEQGNSIKGKPGICGKERELGEINLPSVVASKRWHLVKLCNRTGSFNRWRQKTSCYLKSR